MGSVQPSCLHRLPHAVENEFIEQNMHYFGSGEELWSIFI